MGMMLNASHRLINRGFNANQGGNSLIIEPDNSAYFERIPASAGDRRTGMVRYVGQLCEPDVVAPIVVASALGSTTNFFYFGKNGSNKLVVQAYVSSSLAVHLVTDAEYLDPIGEYDAAVLIDTTDVTNSERVKLIVGGVRVTDFSTETYPAQNTELHLNADVPHRIGRSTVTVTEYGSLKPSFVEIVSGRAPGEDELGSFDNRGVWMPKPVGGDYGSTGSLVDFAETGTDAELGYDHRPLVGGQSANNWSVNNITTDDVVEASWSNNFAASNLLDTDRTSITTSYGNLKLVKATASNSPSALATIGVTTGKYYAELTWVSITDSAPNANYIVTGVATRDALNAVNYFAGNSSAASENGDKRIITAGSSSGFLPYGDGYWVAGSKIGIALDLDAGEVTFYKNGVSQGSITLPATSDPWYFYNTSDGTNNGYTAMWNFGQKPFTYAPPAGFKPLNTANLPRPAKASEVTPLTGSFTGTASANPNFVYLGYTPDQDGTCTINGNAITWGTHAIATAWGFYTITSSASYNASGSNTYSIAVKYPGGGKGIAPAPAQIN